MIVQFSLEKLGTQYGFSVFLDNSQYDAQNCTTSHTKGDTFLTISDFCMKFILSAFTRLLHGFFTIFAYFNKRSIRIRAVPNNREEAFIHFSIMSKLLIPQQHCIYISTSKIIFSNRHFLFPYVRHFKYAEKMSRNFPVPLITLHGYIDRKHSSY